MDIEQTISKRLHVVGRQELALLLGGSDRLPADLPAAVQECPEANIPENYGTFADGTLMRTLQDFCFYMEDGVPAPIEALDDKFRYVVPFPPSLPRSLLPPSFPLMLMAR